MGYHIELQTIRSLIQEGFGVGIRAGLRRDHFVTLDGSTLYDFFYEWYHDKARYGTTPTDDILFSRFRNLELPKTTNFDMQSLVTVLNEEKVKRILTTQLPGILDLAEVDPMQAVDKLDELRSIVIPTQGLKSIDVAATAYGHIKNQMGILKKNDGIIGVPWPYNIMNAATGGMVPGKFTLVYAVPKTGKSMFCLSICAYCYVHHNAKVAVIVGKEMDGEDVLSTLACMVSGISLERYWEHKLRKEEEERMLGVLEDIKEESEKASNRSRLVIYEDYEPGTKNMEVVLHDFKPDLLYYDALYSNEDNMDPKKQARLVSATSMLTKRNRAHILASWQANIVKSKDAEIEDQADFSYTQDIMAKPDLVLKLRRKQDDNFMNIAAPASRSRTIPKFKIHYKPGESMEFISTVSGTTRHGDAAVDATTRSNEVLW